MAHSNVVRIHETNNPALSFDAAIQTFSSYSKSKNLTEWTIGYYRFPTGKNGSIG